LPKHDAHIPPVDFLILTFFICNVGNGPGCTNSDSIFGKLTDAPCKSIATAFFVTVLSSLFIDGIIIGVCSG
jgi:hypothetical protein